MQYACLMRTLLLLIAAAGPALAESPAVVRATGEASVAVQPDQTRVRLSVVSTAANADRAAARNAARCTELIARAREVVGQAAEIHTANYSMTRGYSGGSVATNTIEIRVPDPALTGRLIDVAAKAGAQVINGLEAGTSDDHAAWAEAIRKATLQARSNAEAMAAALHLKVLRVLSAEPAPEPGNARTAGAPTVDSRRMARFATPIEPPSVEVRARVMVTLEVAP
jgi:uncharacterized protein YggE